MGSSAAGQRAAVLEEPVAAEDLAGHRAVRERVRPVPIQTGENWWFPHGMANAVRGLRVPLCDGRHHEDWRHHRLDGSDGAGRSGGAAVIKPYLCRAERACDGLFAPTASWFEYLDIAGAVLTERLVPVDGMVTARGPGLGLNWDEHEVGR